MNFPGVIGVGILFATSSVAFAFVFGVAKRPDVSWAVAASAIGVNAAAALFVLWREGAFG